MINKKELSENIEKNHLHVDKEKIVIDEWFECSIDEGKGKLYLIKAFNETTNKEAYFVLSVPNKNKNKMALYRYNDHKLGRRFMTYVIDRSEYLALDIENLSPCSYLLFYSGLLGKCKNIFII